MKSKIYILTIGILSLIALFVYNYFRFNDGRLHVVFCNVGQGDAIFIRTPAGADILIDGGSDDKVLSCLSSHMPFWDRDIEAIFISYPDADHITGILDVVKRYRVDIFHESEISGETKIYAELEKIIKERNIVKRFIFTGNNLKISDGVEIKTLWPDKDFVQENKKLAKNNKNLFSLVQLLTFGEIDVLLTGDIETKELNGIVSRLHDIEIIKLPHHGAKTGVDSQTFQLIKPGLAVISVGANNKYGHPAKEILSVLEKNRIQYKRTDMGGEVEVIISSSDSGFEVK